MQNLILHAIITLKTSSREVSHRKLAIEMVNFMIEETEVAGAIVSRIIQQLWIKNDKCKEILNNYCSIVTEDTSTLTLDEVTIYDKDLKRNKKIEKFIASRFPSLVENKNFVIGLRHPVSDN